MDLAEQIDDFIPSLQSAHSEMDSLIMLIFIVVIATLLIFFLGRFLYQKYLIKKSTATTTTTSSTSQQPSTTPLNANAQALLQSKAALLTSSAPKPGARRGSGGNLTASNLNKTRSLSQQQVAQTGVRKRLTRRSPGPEVPSQQRRARSIPPPASVSGTDDTTSTWASQVFKWLYSDLVIVNDLLYGFITVINQTMARNASEENILIEVVRILPESKSPEISNIFVDKPMASDLGHNEVVITMDVETTLVLQIKAFRQLSEGKTDVLHYRANVRFRGHLSVTMNFISLSGEMRIEGYPDIKVTIASIGPIKGNSKEEKEIQDMICETLNFTIRDTIYPVDFSVHATCPRALKMEAEVYNDHHNPMEFPNPYDYMGAEVYGNSYNQPAPTRSMMNQSPIQSVSSGRRLLVKIVKGEGIVLAKDPYCVVEMDEPPQKNQTGGRQGANPFWDEHFLFDLSPSSSEILFEVYDRSAGPNDLPKFLGLGLVGLDELAVGASSSQIIGLQPRPYETDPVSGAIQVEFVFIEGAQVPAGRRPYKLKEALKLGNQQQNDQMLSYETSVLAQRASPMIQRQQNVINGSPGYNSNLNPNSRTTSPTNELNSLRPINYSSPQRHSISVPSSGSIHQSLSSSSPPPNIKITQPATSTPIKPQNSLNLKISMIQQQQQLNNKEASMEPITGDLSERGRERKKTTIFGTLRKRLSRSKTRNEDKNGTTNGYQAESQQQGISPTSLTSNTSSLKSPTSLRMGISGSRRSSVSEMSGLSRLSSISNKTFLHEASTLVLEVIENGVKRHYLVPMNIAQKPRWRRKGVKLHVYNDHTFVAKHLPSGVICEVCMLPIPFRLGKQGYECRDCLLKCCKQCHVRAPRLCPKPTIQSIELSSLPVLKDF